MTKTMRKAKAYFRVTKVGAHLFPEDVTKSSVHLRDVQGLADGFAPSLYCHSRAKTGLHASIMKTPELHAIVKKSRRKSTDRKDALIDVFVSLFPNGTALFKDKFECFLVPNLDQWFGFYRLPSRLKSKDASPLHAVGEAYRAVDHGSFVGTCGTAEHPPKLRVAIHVRLGDLRGTEEGEQAVDTLATSLQLAADLQHRQPATKGTLHVLVVSDSSATELAAALAKRASKRKHPVRIDVQTERRWSDGVSHFDEATTSGLQPNDLNLTFIGVGNPLVALDCLASANVVLSPCATSDPLFSHPHGEDGQPLNVAKDLFGRSGWHVRCSNFIGVARLLSSGAFHGVPPRELGEGDVAKRSNGLAAVLPNARDHAWMMHS